MTKEISQIFTELGAQFISKPESISKKLQNIKGLLFDWDGVFNSGIKSADHPSTFSEIDSMGINMLRFAIWLETGKVPFTGIITGQINDTAFELSKREHFNAVYFNFKSKKEALQHIRDEFDINASQMVFVFDDILDCTAAKYAGLSMLVRRTSSPLFTQYVLEHDFADYVSAHTAGEQAIREICELILGLKGVYHHVLDKRIAFSEEYVEYLSQRNQVNSTFYHKSDKKIIETVI
jgi:3-deoxy-D-manno-octulosonate 8-phosphate phosphatase (KDO 8-P phosphatase)